MLANDVLHTIGNTPHIRINRLFGTSHSVYVKSERANPGGSIKDRIALSMVEAAEASGALQARRDDRRADLRQHRRRPGDGRRGQGLPLILVMPDSMSVERRRLMLAYGATFVLTPREKGMNGSIAQGARDRRRDAGRLDAAAVRQPGQHRGPRAHHRRRRSRPISRAASMR